MEEILHQLIGGLSHYLQGFIHPRWTVVAGCRGKVVPKKKDTKGVPGVSFGEGTASFLEANNMLRQEAQLQFFSPFSPAWNIVNPRKIPTKNNVLPLNLYNKSQKKTSQFRTIRTTDTSTSSTVSAWNQKLKQVKIWGLPKTNGWNPRSKGLEDDLSF